MIDWDAEWRAGQRTRPPTGPEGWDTRAASFARRADSGYADELLRLLDPDPSWTVLDVGCGAGTLACPLAGRTASVTALDFSPVMIDLLRARCAEEGIGNVRPVVARWEDDWDRLGIGPHDLALASRSMAVEDLRGALVKLDRRARRLACVSAPVGDGPRDRRIVEAAGRTFTSRPDYVVVVGLLHALGIHADVTLIAQQEWKAYRSLDEAVAGTAWMLPDATPEELERLRAFLARTLVAHQGGLRLPAPREVRWAVVRWSKDDGARPGGWHRVNGPEKPPA